MMRKAKYALAFVFGMGYASLWWPKISWSVSLLDIFLFVGRIAASLVLVCLVGEAFAKHWNEDK